MGLFEDGLTAAAAEICDYCREGLPAVLYALPIGNVWFHGTPNSDNADQRKVCAASKILTKRHLAAGGTIRTEEAPKAPPEGGHPF